MIKNNRQMAPDLTGIRDDHVKRYQFAALHIKKAKIKMTLDIGCGCGYGSFIMGRDGDTVVNGYDIDPGAIEYGNQNYKTQEVMRFVADLPEIFINPGVALAMFEIIEHSKDAPGFLKRASRDAKLLILSVPNQKVVPFGAGVHPQHYRHYTPAEMELELETAGWVVTFRGSQKGKHGRDAEIIQNEMTGRTLIYMAVPK